MFKVFFLFLLQFLFFVGFSYSNPTPNIVFIHGIASGLDDWKPMVTKQFGESYFFMSYDNKGQITHNFDQKRFNSNTHNVWIVSYYTKQPFQESFFGDLTIYSTRLDQLLNSISELTKQDKFVLIAHSMGGLVARGTMVLSQERWNSVTKILTAGSPHMGVKVSIGVVGQLRDLAYRSKYIKQLDKRWKRYHNSSENNKWGVIGSYHVLSKSSFLLKNGDAIDFGGPGWVALYSSIPFGEWKEALKYEGKSVLNTPNFSYRALVVASHVELLTHDMTLDGIRWAIK